MASRPVVQVLSSSGESSSSSVPLPAVFTAPIRLDVVQAVHTSVAKNKRQPYAVYNKAGHETSAEPWGTGRAVARIARVGGGGTQRSGQAAFGNMCRSGRMFNPTKIWRRWHVKVNQKQRRFATASAVAASGLVPLVQARGHNIESVAEIPLVVSNDIEGVKKTREALKVLKAVKAIDDVNRSENSRKLRAGRGKSRNRKYSQRLGPLVVYDNDDGIVRAFRGLPGVEVASVDSLNLLQLAPGGHLGRFVIWTEGAFKKLDSIWGTYDKASEQKKDYFLPSAKVSNPDVARIVNSPEVQSVLRAQGPAKTPRKFYLNRNPLSNKKEYYRLNPYAEAFAAAEKSNQGKKAATRDGTVASEAFVDGLLDQFTA